MTHSVSPSWHRGLPLAAADCLAPCAVPFRGDSPLAGLVRHAAVLLAAAHTAFGYRDRLTKYWKSRDS